MSPENFIKSYESQLSTQNWHNVEPLISENASVIFSDGSLHLGKDKIKKAFQKNFSTIKSEKYAIENVQWLIKEQNCAAYIFEFHWSGYIDKKLISGSGIGTSVIVKNGNRWQLLAEQLGRKATSTHVV